MIDCLAGKLKLTEANSVVLDVNGVGYGIEMPLSGICRLPENGGAVELWIHTYVREDVLKLFGFFEIAEKRMFATLISLNGVGPKVALAMLSTLSLSQIIAAVLDGQPETLQTVPGIGRRLAEKVLLELKPKIAKLDAQRQLAGATQHGLAEREGYRVQTVINDVRSALENLGYKAKQIEPILANLTKSEAELEFQNLIKSALLQLGGRRAELPSLF